MMKKYLSVILSFLLFISSFAICFVGSAADWSAE